MLRITISLFLFLLMFASTARSAGVGTYSEGYRMGSLDKFSIKGMMVKSGEGRLLMGNDSTTYIKKVGDLRITVNPWSFSSTDPGVNQQLQQHIGNFVWVYYKQARIKSPIVDTEYEVVKVSTLSPKLDKVCKAKDYDSGYKSDGAVTGRIVKASLKGTLIDSWELIIQQGNAGNQFTGMSISKDPLLYDCAVEYLKSGQKVKILYSQSFVNLSLNRDTTYDIVFIEPIKGLE